MNGPIGHTFLYNLIIIFIFIVFGFLAGTISYYKAFKINNRIVSAIEEFEGYNTNGSKGGSVEEIDRVLSTFGYTRGRANCPDTYRNMSLLESSRDNGYRYCIYISDARPAKGTYYKYGVLTYMNIDLPVVRRINIPVFTKTNQIYKFTNTQL